MDESLETLDRSLNETAGCEWNISEPLRYQELYFVMPIITGIGTIGNSLIVYVIIRGSLSKHPFMVLLMSLAIVNNLVIWLRLLTIAKTSENFLSRIPLVFCVEAILTSAGSILSSWLLVLISMERFIAVFFPFKVHIYCSLKRTYIALCFFALFALIGSLDGLFNCFSDEGNGNSSCSNSTHIAEQEPYYQAIVFWILYASLPFLLICTFNISVIYKIRSQQIFRNQSQIQYKGQAKPGKTQSLVAVMFSACIVFVLTTFPATTLEMILTLCEVFYSDTCPHPDDWLIVLLFILDEINHSANFFLYCLTGSIFRSTFIRLFTCRCREAPPVISSPAYSISLSEHRV